MIFAAIGALVAGALVAMLELISRIRRKSNFRSVLESNWQFTPVPGDHAAYLTADGLESMRIAVWLSVKKALDADSNTRFVLAAPRLWPLADEMPLRVRSRAKEVPPKTLMKWVADGVVEENMARLVEKQKAEGSPVVVVGLYGDDKLKAIGPSALAEWERQLHSIVNGRTDLAVICGYGIPALRQLKASLGEDSGKMEEFKDLIDTIQDCHDWNKSLIVGHEIQARVGPEELKAKFRELVGA